MPRPGWLPVSVVSVTLLCSCTSARERDCDAFLAEETKARAAQAELRRAKGNAAIPDALEAEARSLRALHLTDRRLDALRTTFASQLEEQAKAMRRGFEVSKAWETQPILDANERHDGAVAEKAVTLKEIDALCGR